MWVRFTGFFLLMAAWAVALPVNGTYDEKQHVVRAYAVATGQLLPHHHARDGLGRNTDAFRAPRGLLPELPTVDCTWWLPRRPASCQRWTADRSRVLQPSVAARYSPVYYLPVGLPLRWWPDRTGIRLARLVSALLSATLLAAAMTAAARSGGGWAAAAVVLAATPTAANLAGAVNPNGLEVSAGVLTVTALLALGRCPDGEPYRGLVWPAAAGAALLLVIRQLGPVLLAVAVVSCALAARPGRVRALARDPAVRRILGGAAAVGTAGAAAWYAACGGATAMVAWHPPHPGPGRVLSDLALRRVPGYLTQMVGEFGYGEIGAPRGLVPGWYLLVAVVVLPALVTAGWRGRAAVLAPALAGLALLVALDVWSIRSNGWFSQGRYALPVTAGAVPLAAAVGRWRPHRLAVALAAATVPAQLAALATVTARYQVPAAFPLGCALAGGLLLVAAVATSGDRPGHRHRGGAGPVPGAHRPGVSALTARSAPGT